MSPPVRQVTVGPGVTATADTTWTPTQSGHQCILIRLTDAEGHYEPQVSQRNVDVQEELPPCDVTKEFTFTVYNDSPFTATVDLGLITFNVPPDWEVTTVPSGSVEIGPYGELTVRVLVTIPCLNGTSAQVAADRVRLLQQGAGGYPTIDVEGYIDGELVGGIEIQFAYIPEEPAHRINLPLLLWGG
jgi:hypothetical protein